MKDKYLHYKQGRDHVLFVVIVGVFLIFVGIVLIGSSFPILGLLMLGGGISLLPVFEGVIIDPEARRIKNYVNWLGLKIGPWHSLDNHGDVLVLSVKKKYGYGLGEDYHDFSDNHTISLKEYDIYLANPTHYDKWLICSIENRNKAYAEANDIARALGTEVVQFNPGRRNKRVVLFPVSST
ncbi:MAG: hypothetical protein AAFY71_03090 [Bacteroidota bacterium]